MSNKTRVTLTIDFEDDKDFKMHMQMITKKVNEFLKRPSENEKAGEEQTAWSSHKYNIETFENE